MVTNTIHANAWIYVSLHNNKMMIHFYPNWIHVEKLENHDCIKSGSKLQIQRAQSDHKNL